MLWFPASMLLSQSTYDELIEIFREDKFTRLPVFEETTDNVIGTINMKDLLLFDNTKEFHVRDILREAYFTYEYKNISELLVEMRNASFNIAIVLDEYGQTSGLVAMEDILEEIVGNILDEYDEEDEMIQKQNDGSMIANGLTELEDLEDLIPVTFDKEDYETLNGFLIDELEHIPGEDEKCVVDYEGYRFTVLQVDNNIIQTVKIEKLPEA